ncbi:unnamed protein product, partial [Coccothraustes coccothraustes]
SGSSPGGCCCGCRAVSKKLCLMRSLRKAAARGPRGPSRATSSKSRARCQWC